jgi:hypothetical protein
VSSFVAHPIASLTAEARRSFSRLPPLHNLDTPATLDVFALPFYRQKHFLDRPQPRSASPRVGSSVPNPPEVQHGPEPTPYVDAARSPADDAHHT